MSVTREVVELLLLVVFFVFMIARRPPMAR